MLQYIFVIKYFLEDQVPSVGAEHGPNGTPSMSSAKQEYNRY